MSDLSSNIDISEQQKVRAEKLIKLKANNENPFNIVSFEQSHHSAEIKKNFENFEGKQVSLAGRLMSFRDMGKAAFLDLQDRDGRIQVYLSSTDLGLDLFNKIKSWDLGDIIGVKGKIFKTKRGEISIHAETLLLLAKALEPLPEKFHGLKDIEQRYRRRYLDMIMNTEVMETFKKRTKIITAIRNFLDERDFIEVETPILSTIASGAAARPFVTKSKALDIQLYLRIATELYLKRCIVGGMERVYDMGKNFRNEGIDIRHNPEFTMIELYQAYADYSDIMSLTEDLVSTVAKKTLGTDQVEYNGKVINFSPPWKRISMFDAIKENGGPDFEKINNLELAQKYAIENNLSEFLKKKLENCNFGDIVLACFEKFAEDKMQDPTFVMDYPVEISPLTKQKPENPKITERFEAYICGIEIANAYSELNDPVVQRERLLQQLHEKTLGDDEAYAFDEDFLSSLEIGMPPTGGLGIGIDRLVMFLTNQTSIREVIIFPTMKPLV